MIVSLIVIALVFRDFAGTLLVGRWFRWLREFWELWLVRWLREILGVLAVDGTVGAEANRVILRGGDLAVSVGPVVDVGPEVDEGKGVWLEHEEEAMSALGDIRGGIGALDKMIMVGKGKDN